MHRNIGDGDLSCGMGSVREIANNYVHIELGGQFSLISWNGICFKHLHGLKAFVRVCMFLLNSTFTI